MMSGRPLIIIAYRNRYVFSPSPSGATRRWLPIVLSVLFAASSVYSIVYCKLRT